MAVKEPTQKNKLKLAAREIPFSDDHAGQYYLQPRVQKCLTLEDIAAEVAALSARQEDAEDVGRILRQAVRRIMWFVSSGYSVSTELGSSASRRRASSRRVNWAACRIATASGWVSATR